MYTKYRKISKKKAQSVIIIQLLKGEKIKNVGRLLKQTSQIQYFNMIGFVYE